jgi:hypothetical protein
LPSSAVTVDIRILPVSRAKPEDWRPCGTTWRSSSFRERAAPVSPLETAEGLAVVLECDGARRARSAHAARSGG